MVETGWLVPKLRIVIVESNSRFLELLLSILDAEFEVVATANDGNSALRLIGRFQPHVVVMSLELSRLNGLEVTRKASLCHPQPAVVICGLQADSEIVEAALRAGALGYVIKTRIAVDLIPAIRSVASGATFISKLSE